MRDLIVLDDDDDECTMSSSQVQCGLSEVQRSRMMQQKQLALSRLQAKKQQQTQLPFCSGNTAVLPQQVNPTSVDLRSRPWAGDSWVSTSASNVWRTGPSSDEWQQHSRAVPNQECWEADFHEDAKDFARPSGLQQSNNSAHAPSEVVGEWRSVRKRATPGSSFGIQLPESSDHYFKPSSEPEHWQIFKRQKPPPPADATQFINNQVLAHGLSNSSTFQEPGPLKAPSQRWDLPNANAGAVPPERMMGREEPPITLSAALPKNKPVPSKQQMEVLKAIAQRKSVFVTGSAGTGKSFIVEDALQILRGMYGEEHVFVTASTGLAACAIGGITLHSFAGVGIGVHETKEQLAEKVKKKRDCRARWSKAKALIIDEISMIDGELFDKLEYIAKSVKGRAKGPDLVWGGLQLIVTGDFFQLEPVKPSNPRKYFAFQADCWDRSFDVQVELTHVFRQSDMEFVSMLNEIRRGVCSSETLHRLKQCQGPSEGASNGIEMTRLYPHQMDVRRENDQNLASIGGEMIVYKAKDEAHSDFALRQLDNVRAAAVQPLRVGAQVILLKNLETGVGLVNGARGVVVGFSAPGDPAAGEYQKLAKISDPPGQWPIVRFACDGLERLVGPESWSVLDGDKEVAKRVQIPLMLGWALSVHKCQGMTLDRVETNLSKAFGHGMVYVALSRVKSLQGLRLIGFDPSKIKALPVVAKFYEGLNNNSSTANVDDIDDCW